MKRPIFFSLCLFITGMIYHHNGANDWLSPNTIPTGLTAQQHANEITANMLFAATIVIWALMPVNKKEA
jgi:hypothetical protein